MKRRRRAARSAAAGGRAGGEAEGLKREALKARSAAGAEGVKREAPKERKGTCKQPVDEMDWKHQGSFRHLCRGGIKLKQKSTSSIIGRGLEN